MTNNTKRIILASSSPYRKALLERLGIEFDCISPDVDEDSYKAKISDPIELAQVLAEKKAMAISSNHPDAIVIGSDQLLHFEGKALGKAGSIEKAFDQLKMLSGKTHELITSHCIINMGQKQIETNVTKLKMRNLSESAIKNYLISDNPIDCAGSYKLELKGISLFEKIETEDHTAIIGLPLLSVGNALVKLGIKIPAEPAS